MKLRNKKTGEIVRVEFLSNWETDDGTEIGFRECNTNIVYSYNSLAELNEEWEDVSEEKKEYYCIDWTEHGGIYKTKEWDPRDEFNKVIGNYFETKEEAEKAVKKLKAWKRLKDKCNFRFTGIEQDERGMLKGVKVSYDRKNVTFSEGKRVIKDLMLLFGGEE